MKKDHPSIERFKNLPVLPRVEALSLTELRQICLDSGADDAGLISLDRSELDEERPYVLHAFRKTRSLLGIVVRMDHEAVRSPLRSLANQEFHGKTHHIGDVARKIVAKLREHGIRAMHTSAGFPMEMENFPGRTWVVSHKIVATAAGLGKMGIHRNVIHPKFGNFILLDTILLDMEATEQSHPIDYNPCFECKLCVAACPVGAIHQDGDFDAVACLNHNYREFMGGFVDWVDTLTDSKSSKEYQEKVSDKETSSIWQSLSFGANYKAAYCMAACPAGDDLIGQFLTNKKEYIEEVLNPLQEKIEPVYVVKGSDAEAHVKKRFPHKTVRNIRSGVRPDSLKNLLFAMPLAFQKGQSKGVNLTYHFTFTGKEPMQVTFRIADQKLEIIENLVGSPNLRLFVDSETWINFLAQRISLGKMVVSRKLRFKGDLRLLNHFGKCFPSGD